MATAIFRPASKATEALLFALDIECVEASGDSVDVSEYSTMADCRIEGGTDRVVNMAGLYSKLHSCHIVAESGVLGVEVSNDRTAVVDNYIRGGGIEIDQSDNLVASNVIDTVLGAADAMTITGDRNFITGNRIRSAADGIVVSGVAAADNRLGGNFMSSLTGVPINDTGTRTIIDEMEFVSFSKEGELATGTGAMEWEWQNGTGYIMLVVARVGTAPSGDDIIVDVNRTAQRFHDSGEPANDPRRSAHYREIFGTERNGDRRQQLSVCRHRPGRVNDCRRRPCGYDLLDSATLI